MFGKKHDLDIEVQPARTPATELARIEGGGLVQIIVTSLAPMDFFLFLNDKLVHTMDIESLSISIEAAESSELILHATLNRFVKDGLGQMGQQRNELFPCTLELIAMGRRLSITCSNPDSTDGLWISLGLCADGTGRDLQSLKGLRVLLSHEFLDAKVYWLDGTEESIFPL